MRAFPRDEDGVVEEKKISSSAGSFMLLLSGWGRCVVYVDSKQLR